VKPSKHTTLCSYIQGVTIWFHCLVDQQQGSIIDEQFDGYVITET